LLQAVRTWKFGTRKNPPNQPKITKPYLPSTNITTHRDIVCVYRNTIILVVLYTVYQWEKDPSFYFENQFWDTCNYWLYSSLDSTFSWFVHFSISFASISNSTFFLFMVFFKARFPHISFWYFLLEQDMK
jgi:hypothetical protein